jgi:nitrogen fixation NifU-like protein
LIETTRNTEQQNELYQALILEHNKKPRNFRKNETATHQAEGFNPLCGDHYWVYVNVDENNLVTDLSFDGHGCAISKASASMMTDALKGKPVEDAQKLYGEFHKLVIGELNPDKQPNALGKLKMFSGIWRYPSRVKCAVLAWHAMNGALEKQTRVSTE